MHRLVLLLFLAGSVGSADVPPCALEVEVLKATVAANDKRYEERYAAQSLAITAALAAQKELSVAAMASSDRAVTKAEVSTDERLKLINELRLAMLDLQNRLMPRGESDAKLLALSDRVGLLAKDVERIQTESASIRAEAKTEAASIRAEAASIQKERSGMRDGWGLAAGALGFVMLCIGLFMAIKGLKK